MAGGSIGDLYYGLGLDDSEFNNKLKAIKAEKLTLNAQIDYASITQSIQRLSSMGKTLIINPVLDKDKVIRIQSQLDSIHNKLKQQYDIKIVISEADAKKSLDNIKKNVADAINELKRYDKIRINPIDKSAILAIRELVKELKFLESVLKRVDALNMRNVNQSAVAGARVAEIQARAASRASLDAQRIMTEQARTQRTLSGSIVNTTNAQRGLNQQFTLQGRVLSNLKTLATTYVSIFAVKSFIQNLAQVRGEFELQQVSLRAILRDAEAADKIFGQIKAFSVVSPFEFKDLAGYAKQLSAFQVPVNELFDTTKRLADVSAGLGVGMDRIILAYGQVKAATVLRGQELRQFTEAGIPLVDELAKKFSELEGRVVSAGDVFEKISNRMVSFEMVKDIFADLTNEGGMFYMMQEKQAESLKGKIANLADAYAIMLNDIGEANDGILKGGVDGIASLMRNWEKVWAILKSIIVTYGAYKGAILAVAAAQKIQNLGEQIKLLLELRKSLGLATAAQQAFNTTTKANPYVLVASLILGAITAIYSFADANNKAEEEANNASVALVKEQERVNVLINKLKEFTNVSGESNKVTKERIRIYNELKGASADVAAQIDLEKTSLEELIKIQDEYNNKQSAKKQIQRFYISEGFDDAIKEFEEAGDKLISAQVKLEDNYIKFKDRFEKISERGIKVSGGETEKLTEKDIESLNKIYNSTKKGYEKQIDLMNWYAQQYRLSGEVINGVMSESTKKRRDLLDGMFEGVDKGFVDYKRAIGEVSRAETDYQSKLEQSVSKFKVSLEDKYGSTESWSDETKALIANLINSLETDERFKGDIKIRLGVDVEQIKIDKVLKGWRKSVEDIAGEFYRSELANNETELLGVLEQAAKRYSELADEKKKYDAIDFKDKNEKEIAQIKDKVSAVNKEIEAQKALLKYYNQTLPTSKGGGAQKDEAAERFKAQIELIKKAQAQYEKYVQIMSSGESVKKIQTDIQFKELPSPFKPDAVKDELTKIYNILGNSPEQKKLKQQLESTFTDIDFGKLKKDFDSALDAISKEVDSYKGKYDLYEQLFGITGDQDLAINLAFKGDFENVSKGIVEQIQQGMLEAAADTDLTLNQIMNLDFTKNAQDLGISEKLKDFLQKSVDEIGKIQIGNVLDFQKLVAEYSSVEDKIKTIQSNGASERTKISETYTRQRIEADEEIYVALEEQELAALIASKKREDEAVRGLMSEMLQLTPFWQKLFGDLDEIGYQSLTKLSDKAKEVVDSAKVKKDKDGKIEGYTVEYDKKSYDISVDLFEKLRKQSNSLDKDLKKSNPFKTLFDGIKEGEREGEDYFDFATRISGSLTGIMGIAKEVGGSLSEMFSSIGNEKAAESIDFSLQLGEALTGMMADLSSGNPVQMVAGMIKGVAKVVTLFSQRHDNKLEKSIKASEKEVRRLQNAYKDLDREIDKSIGTDKYKHTSEQIGNLEAQQVELSRQAQAERDKKKTDGDKVADLERQYVELGQQIQDVLDNIRDEVIGSTANDIANELGNAFFDAFAAGEDYAEAWGLKVKDIVGKIVKQMLIDKLLSKKIEAEIDKYSAKWMDEKGNIDTDKVISSSEDFYNGLMNIGSGFQSAMEALTKDPFFMKLLGPTEEAGKGLSEGIKGVTEDTAQLLASYLNAIRGSVLLQELYMKNIDMNVEGIYQAMGGSPNITTINTIPPEIISAISEPFRINNDFLRSIDLNIGNMHSIAANSLAQLVMIQANTLNTANATRQAVEELRGVISPGHPKGGNGIKVWA